MWNEIDLLLTANPALLLEHPSDKILIKYETDYNKTTKTSHSIKSLKELEDKLKEITLERLAHLQKSYKEMGYDHAKAKSQSLLAYSVYVGFLHMAKTLYGALPGSKFAEDYAKFVADQLIPKSII